jgi:EpsI family protein
LFSAVRVKDYLTTVGDDTYHVTYWYFVGGRMMSERYEAKWRTTWNALVRRRSDGAVVVVRTKLADKETIEVSRERVRDFLEGVVSASEVYFQES